MRLGFEFIRLFVFCFVLCIALQTLKANKEVAKDFAEPTTTAFEQGQSKQSELSSKFDDRWEQGGLFEGFEPADEIIENRTAISKTFRNPDGSRTVQFSGILHYYDEDGNLRDIDLTITENISDPDNNHRYSNRTNAFLTFLPEKPGEDGMKVVGEGLEFNWWQNPHLEILDIGGESISTMMPKKAEAKLSGSSVDGFRQFSSNRLIFADIYPGMDEVFEITSHSVMNDIVLRNLDSEISENSEAAMLGFSQFVPLDEDAVLLSDGRQMTQNFEAVSFSIAFTSEASEVRFAPVIAFDSMVEDRYLAKSIHDGQLGDTALEESVFGGSYLVQFVEGGIRLTATVSLDWLRDAGRSYPVTIDPEVEVIASGGNVNTNCLWDGRETTTRLQALWLSGELTSAGLPDGAIITSVAVTPSAINCQGLFTGLRIRMQGFDDWFEADTFINSGYTDCYEGSQFVSDLIWYYHDFSTYHIFDAGQNLLIDFTMKMDEPLCPEDANFWRHNWHDAPRRYTNRRVPLEGQEHLHPQDWFGGGQVNMPALPQLRIVYEEGEMCEPPNEPDVDDATICFGQTATLVASSTDDPDEYFWYEDPEGTIVLGTGATFATGELYSGALLYVAAANENPLGPGYCYSDIVTVSIDVVLPSTDGLINTDYVWLGNVSGNWNLLANWLIFDGSNFDIATSLPGSSNNVYIREFDPCPANTPAITAADATCRNLVIEAGMTLQMSAVRNLNIHGSWMNNGSFIHGNGRVTFADGVDDIVTIGGTSNTRFFDIKVSKTVGEINVGSGRTIFIDGEIDISEPENVNIRLSPVGDELFKFDLSD